MARSGYIGQVGRKKGEPAIKGAPWYFIADIAPEGAKRKQVKRGGFRTKDEAQEALNSLLADQQKGAYVEPSRQTFETWAAKWLDGIAATIRPSTLDSYRRNLEQHVFPTIGPVPLRSLDASALDRLYAQLLASGRRDAKGGGLSPRTVRYIATIIHRTLGDAVRKRQLSINPADASDPPSAKVARETKPAMVTWTAQQLDQFLTSTVASRHNTAWTLLATTGMRRGEALGLTWNDINLEKRTATIRRARIVIRDVASIGPTKTGKPRVIELDAKTVATLRTWKARQAKERLLIGRGYLDEGWVFTMPDGRPYNPKRFSREFDRAVAVRKSLPRITVHGLRHTWATLALEAGIHVKVVSERLGHGSIAITLDIYSHVTPAMASNAAEKVAQLIFGGGA